MSHAIVVPCYNEEQRLPVAEFDAFVADTPGVNFIFVNDGSRDGTLALLEGMRDRNPERYSVVDVQPNGGKAEAVRAGLNAAFGHPTDVEIVGYFDADLATPLAAIPGMLSIFDAPEFDIVIGARVQLLGRSIERQRLRHYAGRVFATCASMVLDLPVYDTQCGAKLFRMGDALEAALAEPFVSGWAFDVELLRRLQVIRAAHGMTPVEECTYELPLARWLDVKGSKVKATDFPVALGELAKIYLRYRNQG